jgi:hypothetical protein
MLRTACFFPAGGRLAQALSGGIAAGGGRLFGGFEERRGVARFRHPASRQAMRRS